ncbi:hypothetical protein Sme01_18920 [Sphaerisporangium melleum]|uniref:Uncharacterized protein n=1 Tax=Sphaerisporangium melleum TaxID=321316 RepID=A0A917VP19_9ACTN|nr:hypothetical protein [Sphaerisporangium melleum]GGL03283.1 hypothetical protein GCM10007964_51730 [Sphaerisporangium melleum]GII69416.1 hypothetical protein Sme01_18920 [Sphaerisporangium melleum]
MLNEQATKALELLYARAKRTTDNFDLERIERALDEIIRLNDISPPPFQVRSAPAHASQVLKGRRKLAKQIALGDLAAHEEPRQRDYALAVVDLALWLNGTTALTTEQRQLAHRLASEEDSKTIAAELGVPITRTRERISRARQAARAAWAVDIRQP